MKKITGILGIAVFAMAMFFNTNALNNSNEDLNLTSLITTNQANAECASRYIDDGHCLIFGGICLVGPGANGYDCDTSQ